MHNVIDEAFGSVRRHQQRWKYIIEFCSTNKIKNKNKTKYKYNS